MDQTLLKYWKTCLQDDLMSNTFTGYAQFFCNPHHLLYTYIQSHLSILANIGGLNRPN